VWGLGSGPFEVRTDFVGRAATVTVCGEIDICTSPRLRAKLFRAVEMGAERLVVDLTDVVFIDASGLGVFAQVVRCLSRPGQVIVRSPTPFVFRAFELTGMDGVCLIQR